MKGKLLKAIAVLVGTTIGAGIYGLPYVVARVGFPLGVLYLLILGLMTLLLNLVYGEVILRTEGDHQLTGYGEIYLGRGGKFLALVAMLIGLYGALLAYLIKIGDFLALLTGLPAPIFFSLLFFVFGAAAIFLGLRAVSWIDLIFVVMIQLLILLIALLGLPHLSISNYQLTISNLTINNLFLPYGVILFALAGSSAIPEVEEVLRSQHHNLLKAIVIGTIIPILVYLVFAAVIVGISGNATSDDAFSGLLAFLPSWIVKIGALLGILTMSTSFFTLGYVLREIWFRDLAFSKPAAIALALLPPLALFLLGAASFIAILNITGALTGGLTGILILALYRKAKTAGLKKPEYSFNLPFPLVVILGLIFLLGMLSPFWK